MRENHNPTACVCVCLSVSVCVSVCVCVSSRLPAVLSSLGSSLQSLWLLFRLRVYELLALLPPPSYQGTNTPLSRDTRVGARVLVPAADLSSSLSRPLAESFGLLVTRLLVDLPAQDNLNQVCSELTLLPPLCHHDDLLLVGIDEQVRCEAVAAGATPAGA